MKNATIPLTQAIQQEISNGNLPAEEMTTEQLLNAALAHEIRNPVSSISLAVEVLRRLLPGEAYTVYLDIITRSSLKINVLVNDLVRSQDPAKSPPVHYSMHGVLDEVLLMVADGILLKKIHVDKLYTDADYMKLTDRAGMKMALGNIFMNAIDAMKNHGRLTVVTSFVNAAFVIQIADSGCGISPENLEHIFEPYFTRKKDGLGIGLAATLAILKLNKIYTKVESKKGRGTTFTLAFPKLEA